MQCQYDLKKKNTPKCPDIVLFFFFSLAKHQPAKSYHWFDLSLISYHLTK